MNGRRPTATSGRAPWIFGYGSLMWRPGFEFEEVRPATLVGFRRCFCVYSTHHRGSTTRPGLVLGLDRGGVCHGLAFRLAPHRMDEVHTYLREREQVSGVYREIMVPTMLDRTLGHEVLSLAYVVERSHPSYAGRLPIAEQAYLIRGARGISGANLDYLISTLEHLRGLGIHEPELHRVLTLIGAHFARAPLEGCASPGASSLIRACRHLPVAAPRLKPGERRRFVNRRQISAWAARNRWQ
jgi:cation transport protein ChaC